MVNKKNKQYTEQYEKQLKTVGLAKLQVTNLQALRKWSTNWSLNQVIKREQSNKIQKSIDDFHGA